MLMHFVNVRMVPTVKYTKNKTKSGTHSHTHSYTLKMGALKMRQTLKMIVIISYTKWVCVFVLCLVTYIYRNIFFASLYFCQFFCHAPEST